MTGVPHDDRVPLDGLWRFQLCQRPDADVDPSEWMSVEVPGLWTMQDTWDKPIYTNVEMPFVERPPRTPELNPTGVYERSFTIPQRWAGHRIVLHVGGAESMLMVEVNRVAAGMSKDSRLAAEFDVTELLRDGENVVRLVVVKWCDGSFLEDQDQWWHGGITRSVWLYATFPTYLSALAIDADLEPGHSTGRLSLGARVTWPDDVPEPGWHVEAEIDELGLVCSTEVPYESPGGDALDAFDDAGPPRRGAQDIVSLAAAGVLATEADHERWMATEPVARPPVLGQVQFDELAHGVTAWTAETPHLYDLTISLLEPSGRLVERIQRRIGFRRVEIRDAELLVNGRAVLIRGVNRHDFDAETGRVVSHANHVEDAAQMKRWGFNAVRTSHYPTDPAFLDACDELGLYVIDEANIEAHAHYNSLSSDPRYRAAFVDRAARMVERDRHHPCVIAWSLGNESGYGANHDAAAGWIRRADPSRPLHYEGAIHFDWDVGQHATDIVCPMYPPIAALVGYASREGRTRPVIMCEFSFSLGNSNGSLAEYWDAIESTPGLQGGFIWEWRDHGLRQDMADGTVRYAYGGDFGDQPNDGVFSADGITFPTGLPKPALHEHRHLASPVRLSRGAAHAAAARDGYLTLHNRCDFRDTAWLRTTWELTRDGIVIAGGDVDVAPIPPGENATVHVPDLGHRAEDGCEYWITLRFLTAEASPWAPAGYELGWDQLLVSTSPAPLVGDVSAEWTGAVDIGSDGVLDHPAFACPPELSLWRAPTDNDEICGLAARWDEWGLRHLVRSVEHVERAEDSVTVRSTWRTESGIAIPHAQQFSSHDGLIKVVEQVDLPRALSDLPRVGTVLELTPGYDSLEWFGRGPHETYPDRARGGAVGRWSARIDDQLVTYLRPQECGGHAETRWLRLFGPAGSLRVDLASPSQVSALHLRSDDLADADHPDELRPRPETIVHIDAFHRGVGTAACGPDALEQYVLRSGSYRWTWTVSTQG